MFETPLQFPEYSHAVEFLRHNGYNQATNRSILDPPPRGDGYMFESRDPEKEDVVIQHSDKEGISVVVR